MSRRVFILGSTGSIGRNTVEVIEHLRLRDGEGSWPVVGLSAGSNAELLLEQAQSLKAKAVSITIGSELNFECVYASAEELIRVHAKKGDLVVAAIVGFAGIASVLQAIECGCDIALANKETLVAAGELVMDAVQKSGVRLVPIDSEHSAVFQALSNRPNNEIAKVTLTASGGSLRNMPLEELPDATVEQVLNHPTWTMGAKVTVDSASLMNKALELIEAHWLFGVSEDRLDAIIHPQSVVHGLVEFIDGSVIAQLSPPDMKLPIQYALTYPSRVLGCCERLDWSCNPMLQFETIDYVRYPAIQLAYEVIRRGGIAGALFNAANEVVVHSFLEQTLPFGSMLPIVEEVLGTITHSDHVTFDSVVKADKEARELADELVASYNVKS
ncbi:MAG: 1-deoxy-D-xylulose-5-phosphate reductoisomerase [Phycisphaerae bacterium]|jgi:1-deoxy-D-xylulose-5-phosphate reductoisomerase|nr:1-deoxy-D-xylulose-5-phosphate reductoisomerase [Phycisphaerae bacterium]